MTLHRRIPISGGMTEGFTLEDLKKAPPDEKIKQSVYGRYLRDVVKLPYARRLELMEEAEKYWAEEMPDDIALRDLWLCLCLEEIDEQRRAAEPTA